jgi:hypothetical protein
VTHPEPPTTDTDHGFGLGKTFEVLLPRAEDDTRRPYLIVVGTGRLLFSAVELTAAPAGTCGAHSINNASIAAAQLRDSGRVAEVAWLSPSIVAAMFDTVRRYTTALGLHPEEVTTADVLPVGQVVS